MAPLYDTVTTRVFPGLASDRMALKLSGKDNRLRCQDFLTMARTIGLPGSEAETALPDLVAQLSRHAATLELPAFAQQLDASTTMLDQISSIIVERSDALMQELS